ncbi:hypothetical protein JFV30_32755 [Pseudomonas sp. TH32]|uniref:Uncharacterized protein n=1 Tax=Pseudomonas spelaei TaxID=1055469 RepID=A0A6I3WHE1_9PSED|nr:MULTISPECIES: hypothetical protein [Pseudomonas]MBK5435282.1 hypothetical protein [Pseudomonas sp. TH32]MBK5435971.1 hypothetical protein [Pseudomonas sp. TH32]MBK5441445.1 hypothetical protein [Pseudomonas sp. TH32]MUF05956.1 hypothetical protein [Pseudomonas spelaei]
MNFIRFVGLLFMFFGILASCLLAVALAVLMARSWPILIAVLLAGLLFELITTEAGVEVSLNPC